MQVKIRLYGHAKRLLGDSELEVRLDGGSTLRDLIDRIGREYEKEAGQFFDPASNIRFPMIILVGGKDHRSVGGMETPLAENQVIDFIPPAVGGSTPR